MTEIITDSIIQIETVEVALQGPRGVQGFSGDVTLLTAIAGVSLNDHSVVVFDSDGKIINADSSILNHANRILGLILGEASVDDSVTIQVGGEFILSSWNWQLDQLIYLSVDGALTQTIPISGFVQQIGIPLSSTSFKFVFQPALLLE